MAPRKTPNPRKPTTPRKNRPLGVSAETKSQIQYAKGAINTSFGNAGSGSTALGAGMGAVMDYYQGLPKKQRQAAFLKLYDTIQNRDLTNWSGNPGQIALLQELDPKALQAYSAARGVSHAGGGGVAAPEPGKGMFTKGVSGKSGEFITEYGQSQYAAGEAETATTKRGGKAKKQRRKLVKRVTKKTSVKGKAVRRALRSPGVTASDKKVYKKVAQQSSPKLSSRLRAADRRKKK